MILTLKMFSDSMAQVNVAFAAVNKKVDKLEQELKVLKATEETASGNTKKGQSKS
tara:strand:+ start:421 stop:585 length:165 start_codon:yes stop_codon:yes gene_type:complete